MKLFFARKSQLIETETLQENVDFDKAFVRTASQVQLGRERLSERGNRDTTAHTCPRIRSKNYIKITSMLLAILSSLLSSSGCQGLTGWFLVRGEISLLYS